MRCARSSGVQIDTDDDARRALAMAHEIGIQNVLLTMGSRGSAYFSNGEDIWYAQRQFNIKLVSSVCAGDPRSLPSCTSGMTTATTSRMPSSSPSQRALTLLRALALATSVTSRSTASASPFASFLANNRWLPLSFDGDQVIRFEPLFKTGFPFLIFVNGNICGGLQVVPLARTFEKSSLCHFGSLGAAPLSIASILSTL